MIKKFNENWDSFEDFIKENPDPQNTIKAQVGEKFEDVARRARDAAIKTNSVIFFNFNGIDLNASKYSQMREIYDEYRKKLGAEKTNPDSHIDAWKKYWDEKTKDDSFEMDTIADYAKRKGLSYDAAKAIIELKDGQDKDIKNIKFNNEPGTTEIIGLPSGQVIYMYRIQINYFMARNLLGYVKTWKKPITGGFIPIKLDRYCFEDKFFENIMDIMETITW